MQKGESYKMSSAEILVQNWLQKDKLIPYEQKKVKAHCPKALVTTSDAIYKSLVDAYFDMLPDANISTKTHDLFTFNCATDCINALFSHFVDDDTLVIISNNEHDSVKKAVKNCKNVYVMDFYTEIYQQDFTHLEEECKKYDKVFFYCIGTQISNGIITPQDSLEKIKAVITVNTKAHTFILDDVHGMFITPRDYSIFDFILYTCHALAMNFNCGLCISRKGNPDIGGFKAYNKLDDYYTILNIILRDKVKFYSFKHVMHEYFAEFFAKGIMQESNLPTAPHIFAPSLLPATDITKEQYEYLNKQLKPMLMRLEAGFNEEGECNSEVYLRIREANYIVNPRLLLPALKAVKNTLSQLF